MKHPTMQATSKLLAAMALVVAAVGQAQMQMPMPGEHQPSGASANPEVPLTEGEVQEVNKTAGEITLKHGPLPGIAMGPMTMAFGVTDPKMLETVKAGDKVRFAADIVKGKPTVTRMERLQK
jgi:Cu(I)/Ag(I) efflux system protein CusF